MIPNIKFLLAGGGVLVMLIGALTIQTMRVGHYVDRSNEYQEQIKQIYRANLLTESIDHYNARIYRDSSDQLGELKSVPDLDDPLPSDLVRLLKRVQQKP